VTRRRLLVVVAVLMVIPGIAMAAWKADRTGSGAAKAATMPAGNQPSVTANGRDLTITWSASQLNTTPATSVTGYVVKRYSGSALQPMGGTCTGTVTGTSCTETVSAGDWQYSVTPKQGGWTGAESAKSTSISVGAMGLSLSPSTVDNSGGAASQSTATVSGFLNNEAVTFYLDTPPTTVIGTATTGAGGSGSGTITIPAGTATGAHQVNAVGAGGSSAWATIQVNAPTTRSFLVTSSTANPTAGTAFTVTIQAQLNGANDPTYTGSQCLTFSGPGSSPNTTAPLYPAAGTCTGGRRSVTFTSGAASVSVTLYKAESVSLGVTDDTRSGSVAVSVNSTIALSFTACPDTKKNKSNPLSVTRATSDAFGNIDTAAVTINLSATAGSLNANSVTIAANATSSTSTSYTTPKDAQVAYSVTAQAATGGYLSVTCSGTTTS